MTCPLTPPVTSEDWSAWLANDLPEPRRRELADHLPNCPACQSVVAALRHVDHALPSLRPHPVPSDVLMRLRQSLASATTPQRWPEILTLDEVAQLLQLTDHELGEVLEDLPAFELAGQIRVRYARLLAWIEQRERDYTRHRAVARAGLSHAWLKSESA